MKSESKRPLNFAILKYMTTVDQASPEMVYEALKPEYGNRRVFTVKEIKEALMTGEQNLLLAEAGHDIDENGKVTIYYKADQECIESINHYIK